jgi:glyoxylase-like metal-dependent hydrolase (beta-lactamase superfamily II)
MNSSTLALSLGLNCPQAGLVTGVKGNVLNTGWITSDWRQVVDSGKTDPVKLPVLVGHISAPVGNVYVDAGLGNSSREGTFPRFPLSMAQLDVPEGFTLLEQAPRHPRTVLMTHLHYDHTSGLLDLDPRTEVWTTNTEWRSASVLVAAEDGPWLFIGDIGWVDEHLTGAERPQHVSWVVDGRPKQLKTAPKWARLYREVCSGLKIVASHAPRWAGEQP